MIVIQLFFHFKHLLFLQEGSLVDLAVNKLMLNYIIQPRVPLSNLISSMFYEANQLGVLRRVGSAAGMIVWCKHAFDYVLVYM